MLGIGAPVKFVGLFDGDMRKKLPNDLAAQSAFLPGDSAIEIGFREMADRDRAALATQLGRPEVTAVLAALEGRDHHDWYTGLAHELGLSPEQLFYSLFAYWIMVPENEAAATQTYNEIAALVYGREASAAP